MKAHFLIIFIIIIIIEILYYSHSTLTITLNCFYEYYHHEYAMKKLLTLYFKNMCLNLGAVMNALKK